MRQLESEVNHANNIKQSSDFINEDEGPQNAYITHFKSERYYQCSTRWYFR